MRFNKIKSLGITIFAFLVIEAIILSGIGMVLSGSSLSGLSSSLVEDELKITTYTMQELFNTSVSGDYALVDGDLYKGDINLTTNTSIIDDLNDETGLEVTLFWGDVRKSTTVLNSTGVRALNTVLDDKVYQKVLKGESVFLSKTNIQGSLYSAYYIPLRQPSDNSIVGVLFTGRSLDDVTSYQGYHPCELFYLCLLLKYYG